MSEAFPIVYLARHGETAWTITGQHTGLTDLPLTERGERNARRLAERLRGLTFARVFTSPLQRAHRTCELAGFGAVAEIDRDLVEWNYGQYELRTPFRCPLIVINISRYSVLGPKIRSMPYLLFSPCEKE